MKVFALPLDTTANTTAPIALTRNGAASGLQPLRDGRLIYTHRSLTIPGTVVILSNIRAVLSDSFAMVSQEISQPPSILTASHSYAHLEEFWFDGEERKIHGFVLKPSGWTPKDANESWPVVLLIHGGMSPATYDCRFLLIVHRPVILLGRLLGGTVQCSRLLAARLLCRPRQSYWVNFFWTGSVCGSLSSLCDDSRSLKLALAYTEGVYGDWGGIPLRDIIKGLKHVYKEYPEIDRQRSYAVGLSYGGYMVNMLQGHARALDVEFAAMACMDGIFNTEYLTYTIDIPFFVRFFLILYLISIHAIAFP